MVISLISGCVVRPVAYSQHDAAIRAERNIANLTKHQEAISNSVSLHEAMARALKYNLDLRVKKAAITTRERATRSCPFQYVA